MNFQRITKIFVIATVVIWIIYDLFAYFFGGGNDSTISQVILNWSRMQYGPLINIVVGILVGHLFVPQKVRDLTLFSDGAIVREYHRRKLEGWAVR